MKTIVWCLVLLSLACGRPVLEEVPSPCDAGTPPAVRARWVEVGKQTTAAHRYFQSATVLADGRVLATGGATWDLSTGRREAQAGAELFDPASRTWAPTGPLNVARSGHRATLLDDGRVLVTGGAGADGARLASAELFEPSSGTWRLTTPLGRPRTGHAQVLLAEGRVMVAGGTTLVSGVSQPLDVVEVFDASTERWATWAPLHRVEPRADAVRLGDGRVFISGLFHTELYDPLVGSQPPPPAPSPWQAAEPYSPQHVIDCASPGSDHATLLASGDVHVLSLRMSYVIDAAGPLLCRSLLSPPETLRAPLASVALPAGPVLFTFGTREAALLDPTTGEVTALPPRIYPRGTSHLLLLRDGSALVTGGDDVPSEVLEWDP